MAATNRSPEVIDLVGSSSDDEDDVIPLPIPHRRPVKLESDDEDEDEEDDVALPGAGAYPANDAVDEVTLPQAVQDRRIDGGFVVVIDGDEVFIPEEEPQPVPLANTTAAANIGNTSGEDAIHQREFTAEDCLRHVLEIFPDICHDHVHSLWTSFDHDGNYEILAGRARLDNIVEQLVSSTSYPKHVKAKLKRKREDCSDGLLDTKQWDRADRAAVPGWAKASIGAICKAEFPNIPRNHISERLATHRFLFQTYVALAKDLDDCDEGARVFGRGRASITTTADADTIALNCGHVELVAELAAARLHVIALRSQRNAAKAKKRSEEENLQKAIASGQTAECSACFDDLPMNRQIHCDGATAHFTCFECVETYIKSEVGDSRCKVLCPAGCESGFSYSQLHLLENKQLLEKLAHIQQEQDIRDAGLDDLESCPFCDYKAIMPPIEEDFEFRCANPECEKVSCRRCKAISHVPISCEQHAKDNKLSSRHQIEEAMTAALVRSCVKCKKQFIKESGCNKMSCMSCGTLQCYVCSAVVKNYDHFDQGAPRGRTLDGAPGKKCPLYDNVEERHEREVKEAEAKARAEVVESNPDVSAEDLEIKVSEAVKKAETDRIKRAGGGGGADYLAGFLNGDVRLYHGGARVVFGDEGDLDEEDLAGMFGAFGGRRAHGRAMQAQVDAAQLAQDRQRREQRIADLRAQRDELRNRLFAAGGQGEAGAQDPRLRRPNRDAEALQGYIPVVFPGGQRRPPVQPAQQPRQPPAAQHDGLGDWPNFFDAFVDGNDPPAGRPPNAAAPNFAPVAANPFDMAHNPFGPPANRVQVRPNNAGRPQNQLGPDNNFFNPPRMPGGFPGFGPPAARQAQNANADLEVLRRQREQIQQLRQQALQQQQDAFRERQQQIQEMQQRQNALRDRQTALLAEQQRQRRAELMNRRPAADRYRPNYD